MTIPRGFTRCDECEDGWIGRCAAGLPDCDLHRSWCPSCSGSGLVPTEKLREDIAAVLYDNDRSGEGYIRPYRHQADAVLRKVAEHIREER